MLTDKQIKKILAPLEHSPVTGALIGCASISIAIVFLPIVLFSGEEQVQTLLARGPDTTVLMLAIIFLGKAILTTLSLETGFKGGPVFPLIFSGTAAGLLAHALLPFSSMPVTVIAVVTGFLTVGMRFPLSVILLMTYVSGLDYIPIIIFGMVTSYAALLILSPAQARTEMMRLIPA